MLSIHSGCFYLKGLKIYSLFLYQVSHIALLVQSLVLLGNECLNVEAQSWLLKWIRKLWQCLVFISCVDVMW